MGRKIDLTFLNRIIKFPLSSKYIQRMLLKINLFCIACTIFIYLSYVHNANIISMLTKQEKNSYVRAIFLILGWGLGLDRFYEGNKKGGILSIIGWSITFFSFLFLKCSGYEYVEGVKNYSNYSANPLIILPLLAGGFGGFLIIKKAFKLAKQFESAE